MFCKVNFKNSIFSTCAVSISSSRWTKTRFPVTSFCVCDDERPRPRWSTVPDIYLPPPEYEANSLTYKWYRYCHATILLFDTFSRAFQRRDGTLIEISSIYVRHWGGVQRMDSRFVFLFPVWQARDTYFNKVMDISLYHYANSMWNWLGHQL